MRSLKEIIDFNEAHASQPYLKDYTTLKDVIKDLE